MSHLEAKLAAVRGHLRPEDLKTAGGDARSVSDLLVFAETRRDIASKALQEDESFAAEASLLEAISGAADECEAEKFFDILSARKELRAKSDALKKDTVRLQAEMAQIRSSIEEKVREINSRREQIQRAESEFEAKHGRSIASVRAEVEGIQEKVSSLHRSARLLHGFAVTRGHLPPISANASPAVFSQTLSYHLDQLSQSATQSP